MRLWLASAYDVTPLLSAEELRGALRSRRPDLLILDLHLAGADGIEICRRIRATPGLETLPVLFLTASRESRDYSRNIGAGGSGYLTKPIGRRQMLAAVEGLLAEGRVPVQKAFDMGGGD